MNKRILVLALLPVAILVANSYHEYTQEEIDSGYDWLSENKNSSLPKTGDGLVIKSLQEIDPDAYKKYLNNRKNNPDAWYEEQEAQAQYIIDTVSLSNVNMYAYETKSSKDNTELKKTLKQVPISFKFKELQKSNKLETIGYSPYGMYTKNGWNGLGVYLKHKDIGACHYKRMFYDYKNLGIFVPKEIVSYDVAGKVTTIYNFGTKSTGYIYNINWYDDEYTNTLECANFTISKDIAANVLKLAQEIDKNN